MKCKWCGEPAYGTSKYCSAYCRWLDDETPYNYWPLEQMRGIPDPHPEHTREMRSILLALRAMKHRTMPCPGQH